MSSVSASGVCMLVFLILIGPLIYGVKHLYDKIRGKLSSHEMVKTDEQEDKDGQEDDEQEENISSKAYLFALIGYAIGIGNVWRFPYVIASNGGAAAVVAYLVCAVFVSWPLFIFEMILGQYVRKTFTKTWETVRPRWLSFGWAQWLLLFIAQSYMAMVTTYTLPYIVGSCRIPLPWTGNSEGYWKNTILNSFDNLDDKPAGPGPIQPVLAVSLLVYWLITYFSVVFGKKVLSKITYVTVTMPVALMIILVIASTTREGAKEGIQFYIGKFDASQLTKLDVWATACAQILFSLGPGFGTAITYSSFVSSKEDVYRAGIIVSAANSVFSIFSGFAVFATVGHLAYMEGVPVAEVATRSGTGLAFITFAEAMSFFGSAENVMSVVFYVMLFTLGLDSSYAFTETLVSSVEETLASKGRHYRSWKVTLVLCILMFVFGLIFTTRLGNEILDVIDMFVGVIFLLVLCFFESIIMNFDLGWKRLDYALKAATFGSKRHPKGRSLFPKWLCKYDFFVTVPHLTGFLFIYEFVHVARNPYGGYPTSLLAWGWALLALCCGTILLTVWKRDESKLPVIEDDPKFQEVLGSDVGDNDVYDDGVEECAILTDDDKLESTVKTTGTELLMPIGEQGQADVEPKGEETPNDEASVE